MSATGKCFIVIVCLVLGVWNMGACDAGKVDRPVRLIFDTDIGNDIDDALALAMIHDLADRGEADLLAVTISKDNPWAAVYVDMVNRFYGRPDVPIGVVRNGKTPEDGYVRTVAERKQNGRFVYPRKLKSGTDAPEAVGLLRKTLAAQPDGSVVIVSVGFMTNLARLLDSGPDSESPLTGRDLIARKVRLYCMMAGAFGPTAGPEYNVYTDADAARKVFDRWPTPIAASGYEIGVAITYPASSIESDFGYVRDHPIAEAYRAYAKMPYDRPTWDLTAVMYAVRPDRGYFDLSQPGTITLDSGNVTRFAEDASGKHRYLTVTPDQITRLREAFTLMVSAPPRGPK
jgi:inosine-uridine nucleoside N-ribohydrolase